MGAMMNHAISRSRTTGRPLTCRLGSPLASRLGPPPAYRLPAGLHRGIRYIRVGLLLHLVSLLQILISGLLTEQSLACLSGGDRTGMVIYAVLACLSLSSVGFAQLDARSRFQDYKRVKDLLFENGFQHKIIKVFLFSRCQREAVRTAARDLGHLAELDRYYRACGFHWYHVLPDILIKKPALLFTRRYWQTTLFARTYTLKYSDW